ncbi:MAG: Crp/Fnr family transcriptional regulator [Lutisporaceae bacterium]
MFNLQQLFEQLPNHQQLALNQLFTSMPQSLYQHLHYLEIPARKVLVHEKYPADKVYILLSGSIQVINQKASGEVYAFARFSPLEIFGEFEAFSGSEYYRGTLTSITPCKLLSMNREFFLQWMQQDVAALFSRTCIIARKLTIQASNERLFFFLSARDRLILHFCEYYEKLASNKVCQIQTTRQQISDEIGFCVKTVNRCIKKLTEENLISLKKRMIIISEKQYKQLTKLVEQKLE